MSAYTIGVQHSLKTFSDARLHINKSRLAAINELELSQIMTTQKNNVSIDLWKVKNLGKSDERLFLYEYVLAGTEKAAQDYKAFRHRSEELDLAVDRTKSAINYDAEKLTNVANALSALSKEPDYKEQAEFLIKFAKDVRGDVKTLENETVKAAQKK